MLDRAALDQVFDLARSPGIARKLRDRPLPSGVLHVIRLAAGDEQVLDSVVAQTGRSAAALRDAATFYIVQVLLKASSDSYRVLGATPQATREELRTHMIWLLKIFHPDATGVGPNSVFASRVTAAWESLKHPDRRELYEVSRSRGADLSQAMTRHKVQIRSARRSSFAPEFATLRKQVASKPKGRRMRYIVFSLVASGGIAALTSLLSSQPSLHEFSSALLSVFDWSAPRPAIADGSS